LESFVSFRTRKAQIQARWQNWLRRRSQHPNCEWNLQRPPETK